ncbi:MAG: cytochrome P450 [Acidimicrobiaceae bacterium]|nr:cytochrome P450 [Acidimicrobiaceae bacterium]
MAATEVASYHRTPDQAPEAPTGCPVSDFTPFAADYQADPYAVLDGLRDTPVFYSRELGCLVVTRMEDISEIFLDPETFGSQNVQDPVFPLGHGARSVLAADDFDPVAVMSNRQPPDHGRIRNHTKRGFSNRRMRVLAPYIRSRSHGLADELLAAGPPADFVPLFAHPLPGETIFRFIGFPPSDDEQLKRWCSDRLAFTWGRPSEAEQTEIAGKMLAYWRYCRDFVASKTGDPGDDFTSELLAVHDSDPEELTLAEVESIVYGLSFAGHEIVSNFLSNALICLLARRSQWDELRADPSLVAPALEEVLRFESPQTSWRRVANRDAEVAGVRIPAGTSILLSLAAANHEPGCFDDPGRFDIHRSNARNHISFGKGIHFCLGARLARLEAAVALEVLTERVPSLRLVEGQSLERSANITFRGPKSLLVAWDRAD